MLKKIQTLLLLNFSLNFATLIIGFLLNILYLSTFFDTSNLTKTFATLIISGTIWQIFVNLIYFYLCRNFKNKSEVFLLILQMLGLILLIFVNNSQISKIISLPEQSIYYNLNIFFLSIFWLINFIMTFFEILKTNSFQKPS